MFRIITQAEGKPVAQPTFLLFCDQDNCGTVAQAGFQLPGGELQGPDADNQHLAVMQSQFVQGRVMEGWFVTLAVQYCPHHYREIKQAQAKARAEAQNKIVEPNAREVSQFERANRQARDKLVQIAR